MVATDEAEDPILTRMRRVWNVPVRLSFTSRTGLCGQIWDGPPGPERFYGSDLTEDVLVFSLHLERIDVADVKLDRRSRFRGALDPGTWMLVAGAGAPEAVVAGPVRLLHLYLPLTRLRALAEDYGLPLPEIRPDLCRHGRTADSPMARRAGRLLQVLTDRDPLARLRADILCQEIAADLFAPIPDAPLPGPERLAPAAMRRVRARLAADLAEPLTLDDLAAEAGLSRAHFLRAFKGSFGLTPMAERQRLRLEAAHRMVTTTAEPLAQVAAACGFADHAHLTRAFRAAYGLPPSALRPAAPLAKPARAR